jgi:NTP pyrophosphatase (non-canonical NTP hydrolase)
MKPYEIEAIHDMAVAKGFYDNWTGSPEDVLAKLALIHSEVSEVLEAYRKEQGSAKILEEFADIFIRCYDLLVALKDSDIIDSIDIDKYIRAKMKTNDERPHKHGNLL